MTPIRLPSLILLATGLLATICPVRGDEATLVDFSKPFDASTFITPIPNVHTEVRDGVLWTRGRDPEVNYPPMVYYSLKGPVDADFEFRYRFLGDGKNDWLWFFIDADDGGGGMDHCLRVLLRRDQVRLHVDGKTTDPNHPDRQPTRPPDKISGLYRVPERFEPARLDLSENRWRTVRVSFRGNTATITLDDPAWSYTLSRSNFPHAKRKLLWMQNGGEEGIEIDDIRVIPAAP